MKLSKGFWVLVTFFLILPILVVIALLLFFYGNINDIPDIILKNRNHLTLNAASYPTLSETINYTITGYSIIVTGIFSYVVWKTSVRSYEVAEAVKSLEDNRDKEAIRQGALITYYELLTGFSNLRELYISVILENVSPSPQKMFFSDDWVKNISTLRDKLNSSELNYIHRLFNNFLILKSLLDSGEDREKLAIYINIMLADNFAEFIPMELIQNNFGSAMKYLNRDNYIVLTKIRLSSFTQKEVVVTEVKEGQLVLVGQNPVYRGRVTNNLFEGEGTLYNEEGMPKLEGIFNKGQFITGKIYEYYESSNILYEVELENDMLKSGYMKKNGECDLPYYFKGDFTDNEISNGFVTLFSNHIITYEGSVKEGEFSGKGIRYSRGLVKFKGEFSKGDIIYGEQFGQKGFYFKGQFKYNRPWTGEIRNLSNDYVLDFSGDLVEGKPHDGKGYIFQNDQDGNDRYFQEWQEERDVHHDDYYNDDEFSQQQEDWFHEQSNKNIRKSYHRWEDFIKAEWSNGEVKELEDRESNKKVVYYTGSKKTDEN
ncbi:MORN repeat-containing protein [Paenibacillus glycinis]|uniref:Uncharacterized protein n=1 Tax=Paenibacillus glycinis TaxID=2697035 RepID=A0ABW9XSD2_9BACL|nr:hypothetical protein [Paenibacillus glycinis]NBD25540.1 hypothetical protein [Paenibacillus glycinis]